MRRIFGFMGLAAAVSLAMPALAADGYHLKREVPVPGPGAAFDYVQFHDGKLYVGHRPEGLQVFDIANNFSMRTVDSTKGSNGASVMPDLGLGVSENGDGTITVFALSDLKVVKQIKVGAELDSTRYDPVTHRVAVFGVPGTGGKGSEVVVFQAPGMEQVGTVHAESGKLEISVADGAGGLFIAAQDLNTVVRFDMRDLKFTSSWPTTGCKQPTGVDLDSAHKRLVVGCRGEYTDPAVIVMNTETGAVVFKGLTGQGNDGVAYDAAHSRILATNGAGANLVVYAQQDADHYALVEVVGTRNMAKTITLDPATGDIYTITAEGTYDASRKNLAYIAPFYPNGFTKDSFRILQYGR